LQPALLGVLERRRFRRVGGTEELEVNVRVVSATHRDLEVAVGQRRSSCGFRMAGDEGPRKVEISEQHTGSQPFRWLVDAPAP
jgi:hypothetical protein